MVTKLLIAWCLMSVCVAIHASGVASALRWTKRLPPAQEMTTSIWILIRVAGWVILLHLLEVVLWAILYWWNKAMADLPTAVYFSAVTYTTTGYGDLVLPPDWRLVGAVEALTGILMCGWSTGFFFAVVSRIQERQTKPTSG